MLAAVPSYCSVVIDDSLLEEESNMVEVRLAEDCPCSDPSLCQSLGEAKLSDPKAPHVKLYEEKKEKAEVFAFVLSCNSSVWGKFNWTKLTTIALVGFKDTELTCFAHSEGVKVVTLANIPKSDLSDSAARLEWVLLQTSDVVLNFMDGVNVDFEEPLDAGSAEVDGYTDLIKELSKSVHQALPDGQVSVDVAWSSKGVDGRNYNYTGLGEYSDLLFVMAYDEQSQIWDLPCSARANSPLMNAVEGINSYTALGIPHSKLILGLPWYGYRYECVQYLKNGTCMIEQVPFRGCPCSDAAGRQDTYVDIRALATENNVIDLWDVKTSTPYFNYHLPSNLSVVIQYRYDNPSSLYNKTQYSTAAGLAGVGMWTANFLDNADTPEAEEQRRSMWMVMP